MIQIAIPSMILDRLMDGAKGGKIDNNDINGAGNGTNTLITTMPTFYLLLKKPSLVLIIKHTSFSYFFLIPLIDSDCNPVACDLS